MAKRGRKSKDPFDNLNSEFKDAVASMTTEDIRKKISDVALLECEMKCQLKVDPEVMQAKESYKNVMEPYREDLKAYRLQIQYCKQILDNRGNPTVTVSLEGKSNLQGTVNLQVGKTFSPKTDEEMKDVLNEVLKSVR